MKHVSIPAQITTVEDRIIGNLTLTQLSLLATPIFIDFGLYATLPKPMHLYLYKLPLMFIVTSVTFTLAIRLKGKLILFWVITLARFKFRAKVYVFNKNNLYFRVSPEPLEPTVDQPKVRTQANPKPTPSLSAFDAKSSLNKLNLNLNFIEEKKGRLYVYVSESE